MAVWKCMPIQPTPIIAAKMSTFAHRKRTYIAQFSTLHMECKKVEKVDGPKHHGALLWWKKLEASKSHAGKGPHSKKRTSAATRRVPNREGRTIGIPHQSADCSSPHRRFLHQEKSRHHGCNVKDEIKEELKSTAACQSAAVEGKVSNRLISKSILDGLHCTTSPCLGATFMHSSSVVGWST